MDIFYAIAEPTRRTIIEMLAKRGRLSAGDIGDTFSMSVPAVSQHLKVLREAYIVNVQKEGRKRIYQLDMKALYEIESWTHKMTQLWDERLDRLDTVLKVEKKKLLINSKIKYGK